MFQRRPPHGVAGVRRARPTRSLRRGILGARSRAARPKRIDTPRRGLNDISVLSKSRYGRSLSPNRAVNLANAGPNELVSRPSGIVGPISLNQRSKNMEDEDRTLSILRKYNLSMIKQSAADIRTIATDLCATVSHGILSLDW